MKSSEQEIVPIIGTALAGGFYAGRINVNGEVRAIIVAPAAEGRKDDIRWIAYYKEVPGARSYFDGMANTIAMAEAGSELAIWARDLRIAGFDDWYIPSQDELEVMYRNLKPTNDENSGFARSGINLSAVPPTRPYSLNLPAQTLAEAFQENGAEAFECAWYWSSTQHASSSRNAWSQLFTSGLQSDYTSSEGRAVAVRSFVI